MAETDEQLEFLEELAAHTPEEGADAPADESAAAGNAGGDADAPEAEAEAEADEAAAPASAAEARLAELLEAGYLLSDLELITDGFGRLTEVRLAPTGEGL